MFSKVKEFSADQKKFMISQILSSIYNSIVSGVLMTGFLLYVGVSTATVGVILSIPLLANVLQVPFAKMWDFFRNSKKVINRMVVLSRLMILSIIFIPLLVPGGMQRIMGINFQIRVAVASVILFFAYIFASSSGIRLNYWMVNSIPPKIQGTFFAFRDKTVVGLTTVISFSASYTIDFLKKTSDEYVAFAVIFFVAAVFSMLDFMVLRRITYEESFESKSKVSWIECISILKKDKRFLRFMIYMFLLSFSMNMANPYYNAYMLGKLELNYTKIMMLTTLQVVIQILVSGVWGSLSLRISWKTMLSGVTFVLGIQFLFWPLVTPQAIGLIIVIFITSGLIATGLSTSQFMIPYDYINPANAMVYLSLNMAIGACGGFLGSLTGSNIISRLEGVKLNVAGITYESMQINMVVSGLIVLLTVLYSRKIMKEGS